MSWDTLFSLQGHGPYILGAYGVTFALMAWEVLALWRRARRSARRQVDLGGNARDAGGTRR
jgi:heme exporter protein CcmD